MDLQCSHTDLLDKIKFQFEAWHMTIFRALFIEMVCSNAYQVANISNTTRTVYTSIIVVGGYLSCKRIFRWRIVPVHCTAMDRQVSRLAREDSSGFDTWHCLWIAETPERGQCCPDMRVQTAMAQTASDYSHSDSEKWQIRWILELKSVVW